MYAIQDGPDFYLFDSPEVDEPSGVVHAPFTFSDGDMATAKLARDWFATKHPEIEVQA